MTGQAIGRLPRVIESLGCKVREIGPYSPLADWAACGGVILNAEAYAIHEANLLTRFTDYGGLRDRMVLAGRITVPITSRAAFEGELVDELDRTMGDLD